MKFNNIDERITHFAAMFENYHPAVAHKYLRDNALMAYLNSGGFFTAPASTKFHGAYEGGLYDHSWAVTNKLEEITDYMGLRWQREESPFIVGMFHDLCKCDQYNKVYGTEVELQPGVKISDASVAHYEYNDRLLLDGHGAKSVMILSQFMRLTEEEMLCIRYHMGAYEVDDWKGFDLAIKKYPAVLWTHCTDQYASKCLGT